MVKTEYFGYITLELWEFLLGILYIVLILSWAARTKNKHLPLDPTYRYYLPGLTVKLLAAVAFACIYFFYYPGGDTTSYYECGRAMANLFWKDPIGFFHVLFSPASQENMSLFDNSTGFPLPYMYFDARTFLVVRIISPLVVLGCKSYLITSILLAWLSYSGMWRLYKLFTTNYPQLSRQMAIAALFIPSVVFWGSGILKDTITLSASCWFVYALYMVFIEKRKQVLFAFALVLSAVLIVGVKPYIFITLLPGSLLWVLYEWLRKLQSRILAFLLLPIIIVMSIGGGLFILSMLGGSLSKFELGSLFETATITQRDLKQDYYGGNSFDIGDFDPTFAGVMSKVPIATVSGLFRPFPWEIRNVVMAFSGLENIFLLVMTIFLVFRIRTGRLLRIIATNPLLFFSISFALLFAFSVGLTTANFGALVRYKIPLLPFYVSSIFILFYYMKNRNVDQVKKARVK